MVVTLTVVDSGFFCPVTRLTSEIRLQQNECEPVPVYLCDITNEATPKNVAVSFLC